MSETKNDYTVEFFVHNPLYITVEATSREEAEDKVSKMFESPDAYSDAVLRYLEGNEFADSDYSFGTTLLAE